MDLSALSPGVYVLLYHHIGEEIDWVKGQGVTTPLEDFRDHLDALNATGRVIPLRESLDRLQTGGIREAWISITFDDGFRSFHDLAMTELVKRHLPATVFVTTRWASNDMSWRNRLAYLIQRGFGDAVCETLRGVYGPAEPALADLHSGTLMKWTKNHFRYPDTDRAVTGFFREKIGADSERLYMNWEELRTVSRAAGFDIGNHTVTHTLMTALPDEDCRREISGAQREIQDQLGVEAWAFAYPYGGPRHFDERIQRLVSEAKLTAFSAHGGVNRTINPTDVKRITLTRGKAADLFQKLKTG